MTGPDGTPVTDYEVAHEKRLHLVAVRRDFTGFQHVHPEQDADGAWTTASTCTAGSGGCSPTSCPPAARADPRGRPRRRRRLPTGAARSRVRTATVDGYTVTLDGELTAGTDALLTLDRDA